jgi:hypothetical protein
MKQFKEDAAGLRTVLAPLEVPENNTRLQVTIQVSGSSRSGKGRAIELVR